MTQYIKKLPAVFQTVTEKKFFDATFDQVFSKKDSEYLAGYIGRRDPGTYNPISDFYLPEPSKNRTWWQLEPTVFARDEDTTKTNVFFYEDLLDYIEYYGGNTKNQDRLFSSEYYSWAPPIDFDMFVNYQNYYWVEQGLPVITISGVLASEVIGQPGYTTPPTATPPNFELTTGMTISLSDDPVYSTPHVVENIGGCIGIRLVPQFPDFTSGTVFEFLPWDGFIELSTGRVIDNRLWDNTTWDSQTQPTNGDYITIERGSLDRNAWSRTNKWFHIDTINRTINATGANFPVNATRALRPIIQFIADLILYKSGTQFRSEITYGFRNNQVDEPLRLASIQGQPLSAVNTDLDISISNGDLVCFFNDDSEISWDMFNWELYSWEEVVGLPVNRFIFRAVVQPDDTVYFFPETSFSTPVVDGDIVFVLEDGPYDGALRGQTWFYENGIWQEAFNDKTRLNQPPLFQLYDHDGIELDNTVKYPLSNFRGSKIFSYKVNETPGATIDPVLQFPIVYTSLGQSSDIVFENDLMTQRYGYRNPETPIDGYYYYKTVNDPVLYNNWNLYDPCPCDDIIPPPPCNCIALSKQRVIDKFVVGYGTDYQFALSVTPYGYPSSPDIIVSVNGTEVKSAADQPNGYTITEINNRVYVILEDYINSLTVNPSNPPVVEVQTYTHGLLENNQPGYFQIPQQLEANPTQLEVFELSASGLYQQFTSIIEGQIGIEGQGFGAANNYRDTRKNRSVGQYILQNTCPALKSMLFASNEDIEFIPAVRFSNDEYTKFKNKYVKTAKQLIDQEFNPLQYYTNTVSIGYWVDEILKIVNISKEFSNAFAYSYMVANGTPFATEAVTVPVTGLVTLSSYVDLSSPTNSLYIYEVGGDERLLVIGKDYRIVSTNLAIEIEFNLAEVPAGTLTSCVLYKNPLPAYIPSTPTKIGSYPTFVPRIELDTSFIEPTFVIIGHDGSKSVAYGDYRDRLILELEIRIYNLIESKFRDQYSLPLQIQDVQPGFFRQTRYSREEYLEITVSYLNKWSAKNRANYRLNDWAVISQSPAVNPDPYTGNIWKLYNYRLAKDTAGNELNLPGNWKGIFQYYFDTIYPNTRPWEMLGFSDQPEWWVAQYGPGITNPESAFLPNVYPNTLAYQSMWEDLEAGIIRQGPRALYDPETLLPIPQLTWARPGLSAIIPVDAAGMIISVMSLFDVVYSGNPYAPFDNFDLDWAYGDGAPVEQAWYSSVSYPFTVQEILYLTRPGPYGELFWDTVGTTLSPGMIDIPGIDGPVRSSVNWQYVQNDVYTGTDDFFTWMRPRNKDQLVHAELIDNVVTIRYGYQRWLSDKIMFLGKNVGSTLGQKVRTLDVNLANKFAGFTNKDTTQTYIESVAPGNSTSSLIIPTTNYQVMLHKSPTVETYSYSGVVVRALEDGTFIVYGYDLLSSEFTVLERDTLRSTEITVGGTPAEFRFFETGVPYRAGEIVRYNGIYYLSLAAQTPNRFDPAGWQKLKALPTVGGVSVSYRPDTTGKIIRIPYGSVLNSVQEVFDLLIGWGDYLASQGWHFDEVDKATNQISDWLYSGKQFLFWLNTSWAPDASIQLSPLANTATLTVARGYPEDVESLSNGVYSILDKFGVAIPPTGTSTDRDGRTISVSTIDVAVGGIYYLQINTSETEHVLIFDNTTSFNDIVYSPLLRARQQRIRFNGFRSNNWYGKMEAPGYLVIEDQLVPNFDSIVDSMRYFYDSNVTLDNPSIEDLGRHLIGYESKSYLDNLEVSNDVQYLFYKGAIRQKGTQQAFDKLFRSTKIQTEDAIEVFEEWAIKKGDFGNTVEQVSIEFQLQPEQNTGEVVVARLNYVPSEIGTVRQINIFNAQNSYRTVPRIVISAPDADPTDPRLTRPIEQARAFAVLDANGVISRVDMTNHGYGYLTEPVVTIDSGAEPHDLDRLYAIWQGSIVHDETLDNIVEIDIDETDKWTVRPVDPSYSLVFPETARIDYNIPNAGYVNFNDVNYARFDPENLAVNWGSDDFNPANNQTVWVAKTFTEDWNVYKMIDETAASQFTIATDENDNLFVVTPLAITIGAQGTVGNTVATDFGSMISLQVISANATATIDAGIITGITVTQTGAGFKNVPVVTITDSGGGTGATAVARISAGRIIGIDVVTPGSGYTSSTVVTISQPETLAGTSNYALAFQFAYIQDGNNYYQLQALDGTPLTLADVPVAFNFTNMLVFKSMRFESIPGVLPSYVQIGDKIWVDNPTPSDQGPWQVFVNTVDGIELFRKQEKLINTSLFKSASVYSSSTLREIVQLPGYDPFKDIFPAIAKQNISFISLQDPARYNVTPNERLYSENINFAVAQVGKLWWDTSSTRYVYYEQPAALDGSETPLQNLIYRRNFWGRLFPGSIAQIYEWVESDVPPADYIGSGTPRNTDDYVQIITSNRFTNQTEVKYYFWVLNRTDLPNIENRTLPALEVARVLQSPKSQGFTFFTPLQQTGISNSYMFYNVQEILSYQGNNVQIEYRVSERDDQPHTQWTLMREGDNNSLVAPQYWDKMVDSICGYTKPLPVSDEYDDGIIVEDPSFDSGFAEVLVVPDPVLAPGEKYGIEYRPRQGMFRNISPARKVFVQAANSLLAYNPIRDDNPSWSVGVTTDTYWTYTNWYARGFEGVTPTAVFMTLSDATIALAAGQLQVGDIVQVTEGTTDGRFKLYAVVQPSSSSPALSLDEVGIQNSAIKLLDTVYTTQNVYGLAVELRQLMNAFRTQVMIDNFRVDQNQLFFAMLNYVISEQKDINWAFKSSYIYVKENNLPLTQSKFYTPDQTKNVIDYISEAKPYHTKIRDYTSSYALIDVADGTAEDIHRFKITVEFGPRGDEPFNGEGIADALYGWDLNQGAYQLPWEGEAVLPPELAFNGSQTLDNTHWDQEQTINSFLNQYASGNPVLPNYNPGSADWPDTITVDITGNYDVSKRGLSTLYPYTFDILALDNPQSVITPESIISVKAGEITLIYGRDYYVGYNSDTVNYTVYFYNNPGSATLQAFVWLDGGNFATVAYNSYRNETAYGFPRDNFTVNVDTKLPVNTVDSVLTPYVGYGEVWDSIDPLSAVGEAILAAGGQVEIPWDQILEDEPTLLDNTVSYRENISPNRDPLLLRNATQYAGTLLVDLPAPTSETDNVQSVTVIVDALTHPLGLDILPNPNIEPGVIWIGGERLEYRQKTQLDTNIWQLDLVMRGSWQTAPALHLSGSPVWVEKDNYIPNGVDYSANTKVWNTLTNSDQTVARPPGQYERVDASIPLGGIWYAETDQAVFLKDSQGSSIS